MNDETLIAVAYRGRPATIDEFAELSHLSLEDAAAAVGRLRAGGRLGGRGSELTYPHPADWAAESVTDRAANLRRSAQELLGQIEHIVADLPRALSHWAVGERPDDPVPVITRHGRRASEDLWYEIARHDTGHLCAVFPELSRLLDTSEERATRFAEALAGKDSARVILATTGSNSSVARERIDRFAKLGVQSRLLDHPPSWFWVDGDLVAVPYEWGEDQPTSVLCVRNESLAGLVTSYFDALWQAAEPATPAQYTWTSLLRLMRQGITLDTASRMIGVNPRTGRRRIAQAMDHYGVSTLFALGVAWARDADRAPGDAEETGEADARGKTRAAEETGDPGARRTGLAEEAVERHRAQPA